MSAYWCAPEWRGWGGTYWLKPFGIYSKSTGGKRSWDICIGFVWTGFLVIDTAARDD